MRAILGVALGGLSGCQVLFPLDGIPTDATVDVPPDADLRPLACRHPGLLLCLTFEDDLADGKSDDHSGRDLDASVANGVSTERLPGERAIATGSTDILVPGTQELDGSTALDLVRPFTLDAWVFYDAVEAGDRYFLDNESQYGIAVVGGAERVSCNWATGANSYGIQLPQAGSATPGQWHHVACVGEEGLLRGHFNGVKSLTIINDGAAIFAGGTNFLYLGRAGFSGNPRPVSGQIDNVRIWDRALSDSEINLIFLGMEDLL